MISHSYQQINHLLYKDISGFSQPKIGKKMWPQRHVLYWTLIFPSFFMQSILFWDMVHFVFYSELETCKISGRDFCKPESDANQHPARR